MGGAAAEAAQERDGGTPDTGQVGRLDSPADRRPQPAVHRLRVAAAIVVGGQFVVTVGISTLLFHRFHLAEDFGIFNQAWTRIGTGHLNPYNSIYGFSFYKSHFELIMWPLALLHLLCPVPIVLLWIQDATACAAELVAVLWIIEHLRNHRVPARATALIVCGALIAVTVNPLLWGTVTFDFHFESTATLFAVLAARALYNDRFGRAWIWIGLMLLCGDVGALYVVGIGISALLAGKATRLVGIATIAAGVAWLAFIGLIGANLGSSLDNYAYLAGRRSLPEGRGLGLVGIGALTHPSRVLHQFRIRLHGVLATVEPAGLIGMASPWGLGVPLIVILTSALNSSPNYIGSQFQNFALFPFLLFGAAWVLVWMASHLRDRWTGPACVGAVILLVALATGVHSSTGIVRKAFDAGPSAAQAAELRTVLKQTPPDAEVVSSIPVVGRFSDRKWVFAALPSTSEVPTNAETTVLVLAVTPGEEATTQARADAISRSIVERFHPVVLARSHGVYAFEFQRPVGTREVPLPDAVIVHRASAITAPTTSNDACPRQSVTPPSRASRCA